MFPVTPRITGRENKTLLLRKLTGNYPLEKVDMQSLLKEVAVCVS
jgi:hypothetical protein